MDANAATDGASKMPVSESEFYQQSELMIEDIAKETGRLEKDVTKNLYLIYLESIRDRDYD